MKYFTQNLYKENLKSGKSFEGSVVREPSLLFFLLRRWKGFFYCFNFHPFHPLWTKWWLWESAKVDPPGSGTEGRIPVEI